MAYTCTLYQNSGFNPVNIPDSPALMSGVSHIDAAALQLLQDGFLRSVRVSVSSFDAIKYTDYARVGSWWYFVTGISMAAPGVAELSLVTDFITTAGGVSGLSILDGITERHCVAVSDDTFGAYTEDDPYLIPSKPLQIDRVGWEGGDSGADVVLLSSTLDLYEMGLDSYQAKGKTFTDETSGETVTIPVPSYAGSGTTYAVSSASGASRSVHVDGVDTYLADDTTLSGANYARALGVESGIVAQYAIPTSYVTYPTGSSRLTNLTGSKVTFGGGGSDVTFQYASVKNQRLLCGDINAVTILTASGNSATFRPEDIYSGAAHASWQAVADPSSDGCPYFAPAYYKGASDIWACNPIQGSKWRQVPLVYTQKEGSIQDAYDFAATRKTEASQYIGSNVQRWLGLAGRTADKAVDVAQTTGHTIAGAAMNKTSALVASAVSAGFDILSTTADQAFATEQYKIARDRELYDQGMGQQVVTPTVAFPYGGGAMRDYVGNNIYIYRVRPQSSDLTKLDKILTMYGYEDHTPLVTDFFTNRSYFNYVRASGVSLGGLPRWLAEGCADQLGVGVRIWHVLPDASHYTDGNR